ncbi:MAG: sigma-70 family RNA polymerase sigma factor [Bacteroidia bacterium]|nr:sigma-70 family RNA polymerase sigma factor [Bacteroidia bacterium]
MSRRTLSQTQIQDEYLLIEAAQKNPRRFALLYERYYRQIFLFVYKRIDEEEPTADVTSQVFLKAMQNLPKYQFKGVPFSAWLYRIAINEVNQYFRESKTSRAISMESARISDMMEEVSEDTSEVNISRMMEVIQQLAPDEVQMIELRFFEQMSFKEVADVYNITENNAKVKMYRLLTKMKKLMGKKIEA